MSFATELVKDGEGVTWKLDVSVETLADEEFLHDIAKQLRIAVGAGRGTSLLAFAWFRSDTSSDGSADAAQGIHCRILIRHDAPPRHSPGIVRLAARLEHPQQPQP